MKKIYKKATRASEYKMKAWEYGESFFFPNIKYFYIFLIICQCNISYPWRLRQPQSPQRQLVFYLRNMFFSCPSPFYLSLVVFVSSSRKISAIPLEPAAKINKFIIFFIYPIIYIRCRCLLGGYLFLFRNLI